MKTAIVLFNLGGPDAPSSVKPFLRNLFSDKAIIRLPALIRYPLSFLISHRRASTAQEVYNKIGGRSPILELTQVQASALENAFSIEEGEWKVFISMRYWHPFSLEVARSIRQWGADQVIMMPLYPQYSTTTTASSMEDWNKAARKTGLRIKHSGVCCYFQQADFIAAHVRLIKNSLKNAPESRLLFSAHGLPEKIVESGDPYQWQVEQTVASIVHELGEVDYAICYQSRVGPLKWIGPSTEEEIRRAGKEKKSVIIVPIAFVSEHSETLVELDMEYKELAKNAGIENYMRVPALGAAPEFIACLKALCLKAKKRQSICSAHEDRVCPRGFSGCGHGFALKEA